MPPGVRRCENRQGLNISPTLFFDSTHIVSVCSCATTRKLYVGSCLTECTRYHVKPKTMKQDRIYNTSMQITCYQGVNSTETLIWLYYLFINYSLWRNSCWRETAHRCWPSYNVWVSGPRTCRHGTWSWTTSLLARGRLLYQLSQSCPCRFLFIHTKLRKWGKSVCEMKAGVSPELVLKVWRLILSFSTDTARILQ